MLSAYIGIALAIRQMAPPHDSRSAIEGFEPALGAARPRQWGAFRPADPGAGRRRAARGGRRVPLRAFGLDDAKRAMAAVPGGRTPVTRRHYGQLIGVHSRSVCRTAAVRLSGSGRLTARRGSGASLATWT